MFYAHNKFVFRCIKVMAILTSISDSTRFHDDKNNCFRRSTQRWLSCPFRRAGNCAGQITFPPPSLVETGKDFFTRLAGFGPSERLDVGGVKIYEVYCHQPHRQKSQLI